jgi:predicted metal-dependent phosphoesterase TrpH
VPGARTERARRTVIDLHTHSLVSDGTDEPGRIAELAAAAGCSAFALTDHDTLAGLDDARVRATALGVTLVDGCEVSCSFRETSAHILIYFVGGGDGPLQDELVRLRADRVARNRTLADRLRALDLPVTYDDAVAEAATEDSVGRPHFAALLVRAGAADSVPDAFDRWLGQGAPAYVPKARVAPADIIRAARGSGGVAVLAHPLTLGLEDSALANAVSELADAGLTGLEATYGRYNPHQRAALTTLAQRAGLVATGGSDYHGTVKAGLSVGTGEGDLSVDDSVLDRLEARRPD